MSNATLQPQKTILELPSAVRRLIAALRLRLRRYSVLSGLLFVVSVAAVVFWLTSAIDSGWFALQRLELPVGLRVILLIAMAVGGLWLLLQHVVRPLLRRTQDSELALLLERRFPEFQDRLITTLEGQRGYPASGDYVDGMLQRTSRDAETVASKVEADDVFDFNPLKKQGWIAGFLMLSVLGCAVAKPGSLSQWWSAFVLCEESYHQRTTDLEFAVLAQPGDRRLSFADKAGQPTYLHPRGADFELEITVPDSVNSQGEPWVVPDRVRVDVIREDGGRSRTYVSSTNGNTFRFILTRLQETVSLEVLGGDYRTRVPLQIQAVTPPSVDSMQVVCDYPEYTGWNQEREQTVPILGSEVSLPIGTGFQLQATSNKPLLSAQIVTDLFELSGDQQTSQLTAREGYAAILVNNGPLVSDDGTLINANFRLVSDVDGASASTAENETSSEASGSDRGVPVLVPSNLTLRFVLHDQDDVVSQSPESLRVRGIPDKPPTISVRTSGVSNSITRRAIVPMTGLIRDDYKIVSAGFRFIVDDETKWRPRNFRNDFSPGLAFELGTEERMESFDVQPLELTEGQTLALTVVARDGCTVPGPNEAQAEPIVFRIVSNEELLSLLYTRELTLRRRFEEVIQQLEQVRDDLVFHRDVASRIESAGLENASSEDRIGLTTCATRSGNTIRRQSNEVLSIVEGFEEIVQQLINNSIPPQQLAETMRQEIVVPMREATSGIMVTADRSVSRFRVAASSGKPALEAVTESEADVVVVIAELKRILESVRDMAEFHEALSDLKKILEEQQRILEETKRQQKRILGL